LQADKFVFAVEVIDAGEAAESAGFALVVEADHDDLLAGVGWAFFAVVFVVFKSHGCRQIYKRLSWMHGIALSYPDIS
jgi:hypothetical protein